MAFVMLGAALALAFTMLAALLAAAVGQATALAQPLVVTIGVLIGSLLVLAVGALPAVRRIEGTASESMLAVSFFGGLPQASTQWHDRWRSVGWLWAHVLAGAALVLWTGPVPFLAFQQSPWLVLPSVLAVPALGALLAAGLRRLAPLLLGPSLRERVDRLEREATELGERHRIAREIHDSVGHALSLVTVQAAAAARVQHSDPGFVAEALAAIESAARQAAGELDHVLGLLRVEETTRRPTPDLADLVDLVAAARRAGLDVTMEDRSGDADDAVPPVVSRELYRVAQEALSNVLRHGSGPCRVRLDRTGGALTLEVTNTSAPPPRRMGDRRGHGLRGIRERVTAIGGHATAGPTDDGWRLRVVLPIRTAR
ncbi:histidine kinase [Nocardioides sp. zg-1228]|uniref:sensor histidine kinase n=1 Tax=Nocardioides sp. zg-1228 TaxID=2763008 RepID=UPI00197D2EAC|nr:histidine kinase [Nocardioides sp. zg-1228]QSF56011.1 two-component sensor histidine kinase [Nocardioides sp. zg-1228]